MAGRTFNYNQDDRLGHRYQLVRRLGQGGMGEVWLAEEWDDAHKNGQRPQFALKLLLEVDTPQRNRFYEEARAHRNLKHRNIVEMYGFEDPPSGSPYLVTEFMPGGSLDKLVEAARERSSPELLPSGLSRELVLSLVAQVADALDHLHSLNYAHRDLKTSNLLLRELIEVVLETQRCSLKLADLGIVDSDSSVRPELTRTGAFVGSFQYAAPEYLRRYLEFHQRRAKSHTGFDRPLEEAQKGDVFALGLILYELWTGTRFFTLEQKALVRRNVRENVDLARETHEALRRALERFRQEPPASISADEDTHALLKEMLKPEPEERPQADEVGRALEKMRSSAPERAVSTLSGSRSGDGGASYARRTPARARYRAWTVVAPVLAVLGAGAALWVAGDPQPLVSQRRSASRSTLYEASAMSPASRPLEGWQGGATAAPEVMAPALALMKADRKMSRETSLIPEASPAPPASPTPAVSLVSGRPSEDLNLNTHIVDDAEFKQRYKGQLHGPFSRVQGEEKILDGRYLIEFKGRAGAMVRVPAPGKRGRLIHANGSSTSCVVIEHSTSYWSLLCGLKWESMPGEGHLYKEGDPIGPHADKTGRVTLRLYGARSVKQVGKTETSLLLDTRAWMDPASLR